ncbi:hypothetical protein CR513_06992, partial [Mucuna pruriens]
MENLDAQFIPKGASLIRPPSFTKEDYPYWRDKMEMYIKSTHDNVCGIITHEDKVVNKTEKDYT